MAKLSSSALRSAAASAREKSNENQTPSVVAPVVEEKPAPKAQDSKPKQAPKPKAVKEEVPKAKEKKTQDVSNMAFSNIVSSNKTELKTEHVNLLMTASMVEKIEKVTKAGGFRSKNAAVIAILEAYFEANQI